MTEQLRALNHDDRGRLETLLFEFEAEWEPECLARFVSALETEPLIYRQAAVLELVKIDLERCELIQLERTPEAYRLRLNEVQLDESHLSNASDAGPIGDTRQDHDTDVAQSFECEDGIKLPVKLGRYELLERVGAGAMGTVYRAVDQQLGREVALKIPGQAVDHRRFAHEAKSAAALSHRHICPVYDAGNHGDRPFLTMPLLTGQSLADPGVEKPMSVERVVDLVSKVALALGHAHNEGVVHRDVKPANIVLDHEGEPIVLDFGLACFIDAQVRLTQSGQLLGTPAYMSPEQIAGKKIGPEGDVYSLGTLMFELLTGRLPFAGDLQSVTTQVLSVAAPHASDVNEKVPRPLGDICAKMLAKEPADRYTRMSELVAALGQLTNKGSTTVRPAAAPATVKVHSLAYWVTGGVAIVAAFLLGIAFSLTWLNPNRPANDKKQLTAKSDVDGVVARHVGSNDPKKNGWRVEVTSKADSYTGPMNDNGEESWLVVDSGQHGYCAYYWDLTDEQANKALRQGWTLRVRLRPDSGLGTGHTVGAEFWDDKKKWSVHARLGSGREVVVGTGVQGKESAKGAKTLGPLVVIPDGQNKFHLIELRFDPTTGTAVLKVNGEVKQTGCPGLEYVKGETTRRRVMWGSRDRRNIGQGCYSLVEFEIHR